MRALFEGRMGEDEDDIERNKDERVEYVQEHCNVTLIRPSL